MSKIEITQRIKKLISHKLYSSPLSDKLIYIPFDRVQFPPPSGCGLRRQPRLLSCVQSLLYSKTTMGYCPQELFSGIDAVLTGQQPKNKQRGWTAAGALMTASSFATQWLCDFGQSPLALWLCKRKAFQW